MVFTDIGVKGRKAWNATGERDPKTGKWVLDLSLVKPLVVKKRSKVSDGVSQSKSLESEASADKQKADLEVWEVDQEDAFDEDKGGNILFSE